MNRRNFLLASAAAIVSLSAYGMTGRRVAEASNDPLATATTFGADLMP